MCGVRLVEMYWSGYSVQHPLISQPPACLPTQSDLGYWHPAHLHQAWQEEEEVVVVARLEVVASVVLVVSCCTPHPL